jgi:hypothetical protein
MEWLVALLVLLGLAAVAGLVWLHFGRDAVGLTARSPRQSGSGQPGGGGEPAERSITVGYLRRRASHYRDLAVKVDDAIAGARCWDLARLLDRAADALENAPEDRPDPEG